MDRSYGTILLVFTMAMILAVAGCSKETSPPPEGSTHQHEHGAMTEVDKDTVTKSQTTCPVMGGEIDRNIYADYEGKRVYFCYPACLGEFKKNPEKYVKKLEDEGVILEKVPTT